MSTIAAITPLARPARPVDAVVERLRADMLAGRFHEHLPPERQLAGALGVSRLTLRAALARLEAEGLVRARQGEGVRVLAPFEHGGVGLLAHLDLRARPELARSVLELRRAVACEAVAAACERASNADLARLEALADAQSREADEARYRARDLEFARALLEAAGSFAALLLMNALAPVWQAHGALADALVADRAQSLAGYALTIALVRARDASAARDTLRAALELADARALERLHTARAPRRRRGSKDQRP